MNARAKLRLYLIVGLSLLVINTTALYIILIRYWAKPAVPVPIDQKSGETPSWVELSPTPSPTKSPSPTITPSPTISPTVTPTLEPSVTPSPTPPGDDYGRGRGETPTPTFVQGNGGGKTGIDKLKTPTMTPTRDTQGVEPKLDDKAKTATATATAGKDGGQVITRQQATQTAFSQTNESGKGGLRLPDLMEPYKHSYWYGILTGTFILLIIVLSYLFFLFWKKRHEEEDEKKKKKPAQSADAQSSIGFNNSHKIHAPTESELKKDKILERLDLPENKE